MDGLIISKYVDGVEHDRVLEIYNPSSQVVDVGQYKVEVIVSGWQWCSSQSNPTTCIADNCWPVIQLSADTCTGTFALLYRYIQPGSTMVICHIETVYSDRVPDGCDSRSDNAY